MTDRRFAFLRAINTGGRRLTNDELLAPFHALGLADAAAYQAAGNIAFRSERPTDDLEAALDRALAEAYGFDAPTCVRMGAELRAAVDVPFGAGLVAATEGRTQVTFLKTAPAAEQIDDALALVPDEDAVVFADRHWWWLPRAGVSDSALPVSRIERIVGPMTMRTVGTVERMLAKFGD